VKSRATTPATVVLQHIHTSKVLDFDPMVLLRGSLVDLWAK
jgi:hypothetical protein